MGIKPLDNRLIVRPFPIESMRSSGLVIVGDGGEKPLSGEVIAIGPGRKRDDGARDLMRVAVGDRIMYGKYAPQPFQHEGESLLSMCEMDVLFIMDP